MPEEVQVPDRARDELPPDGTAMALEWARAVVDAREAACAALSSGALDLSEALAGSPGTALGHAYVLVVLEALPGASKVATRRALDAAGIPHTTRLDELTGEQVDRILSGFPLGSAGTGSPAGSGGGAA